MLCARVPAGSRGVAARRPIPAGAADAPPLILEHLTPSEACRRAGSTRRCRTPRGSSGSPPRTVWSATTATNSIGTPTRATPAGAAGEFHPPDRRGRASRSVDRHQGCGPRPLESRDRHLHPIIGTIRRTRLAGERCDAALASTRAAASGSEPTMPASMCSIPPPGASSTCATIRAIPIRCSDDQIFTLTLDRSGSVWVAPPGPGSLATRTPQASRIPLR